MKLRVTQKNLLFEIIQAHKLPPTHFNFREFSEGLVGPVSSIIALKKTFFIIVVRDKIKVRVVK